MAPRPSCNVETMHNGAEAMWATWTWWPGDIGERHGAHAASGLGASTETPRYVLGVAQIELMRSR
jgi:hypothetical protein